MPVGYWRSHGWRSPALKVVRTLSYAASQPKRLTFESRLRTAWSRRQGCRRNMGLDGPSAADGGHRVAVADVVAGVRNERRRRQ
ncbi:hypothetical protein LF1_11570 [Rubripirellula obstinata]|uniref:Uncharacterized protein n=1 Tax=Rubripirellula obstinata TaxID=406547 RepID=A0A5B1CFE7_9BACT|nr:hypothetical protein LF1_11570 [Rubripirellula obstinata]